MKRVKQIKEKYIIFCEDEKSSLTYLKELWKRNRDYKIFEIDIEKVPTGGDYENMVNSAIKKIKQFKNKFKVKYIKKFLVVDTDVSKQNSRQNDKFSIMQKIARENKIEIIKCEPNFELYLLLHFELSSSNDKNVINEKLSKYTNSSIREVKKNDKFFKKLSNDSNAIARAIENNKKIYKNKDNETDFYKIANLIVEGE